MSAHALLSASGTSRWLICTPSARLEETLEETESIYADEGTVAHKLGELLIKQRLGVDCGKELEDMTNTEYYSEEMLGYMEEYTDYVMDTMGQGNYIIFQEQRLELTEFIPQGFGTTDVLLINPRRLRIIDYKHGKGVPVDAFENSQMKVYALGAIKEYDFFYQHIETVEMTIYQPRIGNISSYEMSVADLLHWGYTVLKPTARMAFEGLGEFIAGEHCRFCRARSICKAAAIHNLQIAAKTFEITTITDDQLVKILRRADEVKRWITAVEEYALKQAVQHNKKWPGMKLVRGRSVRKFINEQTVIDDLLKAGYSEDKIVNKKLAGITELSKKITKLDFKKIVEPQLFKPDGSPTLVDESDGRAEINSNEEAVLEFKPIEDEEDMLGPVSSGV